MTESKQKGAMLPKVGRYEFMAEPFHCDFNDRLFMGHLGNAMLNAADFHSSDRGYGMHYLNHHQRTWVLSRLAIELEEMPKSYTRFAVETWVDAVLKTFTSRNFSVVSPDGQKVYGYGRSIWAMIDTKTRQPVNLLDVQDGLIVDYVDTDKPCPIEKSGRIKMDNGAVLERSLMTYYNDADPNGHINSVKYIEHILDLFDVDWYRSHRIQRFEIAYVAESYPGDCLHFYKEETSLDEFCIRITKGNANETEVVRSKVKFVNI